MFEGAVAGILNRLLGKYVQDLDTENLNVGIFSGSVNLTDLKLKPEALYELDLPIDVKIGTIGRINLQIPWAGLVSQPVIVHIEDVLILVGPAISNSYFDPEREKRLSRAAKRKILQDLEAESEALKGPQNILQNLFTAIVNNIQIYVRNVHVRYEDSISSKDGPLACGLCLQSLSIETTNSKWKPSVTPAEATTVYQMMRIESLSLYWNATATALDDTETAHITPIQYYNWKHYMLTGLDKFSMHHEDFDFLLKPVTCKVKVLINRSGEARVPRLLLDAVLQDSAFQVSRRQHLSVMNLAASFARIKLNRKYRHLHPGVPPSKDIKKWWKYAYNVVIEQRVRPYTWTAIKKHRENYNVYKQTYKSTLRNPNDTELKLDLQKCEDSLPIISVVIAREHAKFELLAQEPDRIEVVESEFDWWEPVSPGQESVHRVELCVKAQRNKTLWSHLSSPEKKKVFELIGYAEGTPKGDKAKQCIEHKLNLTLANCSLTLLNRSKEVLVVSLTQFLASLETRPSAKAYKISARAESIVIEGVSSDGELVPLLTGEKGALTSAHLLAVDLERNPAAGLADYALTALVEPVEVMYVEHALSELMTFFQTPWLRDPGSTVRLAAGEGARKAGKALTAYALSRRKVFQLNVDVRAPCILVPEYGGLVKCGHLLVLDVSRILIKSDLQPPNPALEDATCMELEERLYDRLHAECSFQVLFSPWDGGWRAARKTPDSALHVAPRAKALLVFSNSIMKEYKLLPKYKLNISLSSLKLNLSDRLITSMLDFFDNFPLPVPNTVPVSYVDSGDETIDDVDQETEELEKDKVTADPGYTALVQLRQKIVGSYLTRNRTSDPPYDKALAKKGFQSSEETFQSSDHSDSELEVFARSVDLPGFDDNVSPSNHINTLLRFVVGEIVINLAQSIDQKEYPYIMFSITKICLDIALMEYGPAVQLSIHQAMLTDKQQQTIDGQYLEIFSSNGELFNLIYRKVRADCPEFKSHFHGVEQALVADTGAAALALHTQALTRLNKTLSFIGDKIQSRHHVSLSKTVVPQTRSAWERLTHPEGDPPVPPGATKFSYSLRMTALEVRLWQPEGPLAALRLAGFDADCIWRANERRTLRLYLQELRLDDLGTNTLYPKLIWPDEDKVLEVKYVRSAPRLGATGAKANGELKVYVGRLHIVVFCCFVHQLQQFLEPLIPASLLSASNTSAKGGLRERLRGCQDRLTLAIEIHAPVLLIPQKQSSPNLLVVNTGDLQIENFFKQASSTGDVTGEPILDNVLVTLANVTLCRAIMTLAATLEVQEPILEQMSIRCDIKRCATYRTSLARAPREVLLLSAAVTVDAAKIHLAQRDLTAILAVYSDNLSEAHYIGNIVPNSPTEVAPTDASVKKLQAFLAQGEPVKKEIVVRFTLEGLELTLFSDMEEVLSSPVREPSRGLARLTLGEATGQLDYYSDDSYQLVASLQSLLLEDIRPGDITIRRIVSSQGGQQQQLSGVCVRRPALLELAARGAPGGGAADLRVDRARVNLAAPFLLLLVKTLVVAAGERPPEGGVVNHGYEGEGRRARPPSGSDSTSGYCSNATSIAEEPSTFSLSIQCRQPEVCVWGGPHALLIRAELMADFERHAHAHSCVVALAGLQMMSKLQSKLKDVPAELVLKPCDVEFSRVFKNADEGVKVKLAVSDIEVHLAASTIHSVLDVLDEINQELAISEDQTPLPRPDKTEEDLWSPKKLTPYIMVNHEQSYVQPKYSSVKVTETFTLTPTAVKVLFELELEERVPIIMVELWASATLVNWSRALVGRGAVRLSASARGRSAPRWEPLLEPGGARGAEGAEAWEVEVGVFQSKSYPMSSRLDTNQQSTEPPVVTDNKKRRRAGFESETSADEGDTDNEMTFIRNPHGRDSAGALDFGSSLLSTLEAEESDSDHETVLMDKLSTAIGHLFTDDSSGSELSNEEDSSAPSDAEPSERDEREGKEGRDDKDKAVSFTDGPRGGDAQDSGAPAESSDSAAGRTPLSNSQAIYITLNASGALSFTAAKAVGALTAAAEALADRTPPAPALDCAVLVNHIGPGSTVELRTRAHTDLAGRDGLLATADYDDHSRPSTPGGDLLSADLLEESGPKLETADTGDEWDCSFEGGFPPSPPAARAPPSRAPPLAADLFRHITDETLAIRIHDFDQLTVLCPQRATTKLHVLQPARHGTRYYVAVQRRARYHQRSVVVRSPLQLRNETSYPLELYYKKSDLQAVGAELIGSRTNPFDDKMRIAVIQPQDTYDVPLYVAYHCKLFLLPSNFEKFQTSSRGIWWMDFSSDPDLPCDLSCAAKEDGDERIFAMRVLAVEGPRGPWSRRALPHFTYTVHPALSFINRLPYGCSISSISGVSSTSSSTLSLRLEPGDAAHTHALAPAATTKLALKLHQHSAVWSGGFTFTPELREKTITMTTEAETEGGNQRLRVRVRVRTRPLLQIVLHAPAWLINKTGLPLQVKGSKSECIYEVGVEPVVCETARAARVRVRVQQSAWSRAARLPAGAPGLLVCQHPERRTHYRLLLDVTLSELCPQLTKIITLLPYFLVYNDTRRHLRFMEENEAADLWLDVAPQQCVPYWPQTDSMAMHVKYRDSTTVSHHFPITVNHFTVLRMEKGSALCVEVTGGTDKPFTITFKPHAPGDAPVRVANLCEDLFIKLQQADSGQVALLSPYQSLLYTWDDPTKERKLMWNIYNNKGKGYVADFAQDGYGEEKISFHSVKHSTLVATSSVTSKLSSTFKRLTPKSPDPGSSTDDSDDTSSQDHHKTKKIRKDKVIVYWISFMDGYQRVFALAQDEKTAYQYRMQINAERSNFEVYLSLASVSLSVCVPTSQGVKELAYISVTDSTPKWEVNVSHKWKPLSPELNTWLEDKYQSDQTKCQLKEYIDIDLEKMQMTKPFFSELRRTYNPGVWLQLRKSETLTYIHLKLQRLQIDNQLNEAVFPCVLYPTPPQTAKRASDARPCFEMVTLKQYRPSLNQDVYKYVKVLLQEYSVNLDRGFVNHVFDILNHWKLEEKPAVRLRADLALVHRPLHVIAMKSQLSSGKNVIMEFVHLGPVKLVLSLSSRGYVGEAGSPIGFGVNENRPKLFNSDLLEYLFNSWGSSLCDMKDVVLRMAYLEVRITPIALSTLFELSARHYRTQLVQQFYVLVLGLNILGNPYSVIGDFSRGLKQYYEPELGVLSPLAPESWPSRLAAAAARLLCHRRGQDAGPPLLACDVSKVLPQVVWQGEEGVEPLDVPASVLEADRTSPATVALALTGLIARPSFEEGSGVVKQLCREAARSLSRAGDADAALREFVERSGGRLVARQRLPRHCPVNEVTPPYCARTAAGAWLAALVSRSRSTAGGDYLAHAHISPNNTLLITTDHLFVVRCGSRGRWAVEWAAPLADLMGVPQARDGQLVLSLRQDELVNYFATEEKIIDVPDPEMLTWLQTKIECALIYAMEDKRVPTEP